MNERFISAYEETLTANKSGEVKNLLITDGDSLFLDDAQYALRRWVLDKGFNLVEIDEESDDWLPEIQSRELFYKLSVPNTVLLVRNYAITNWDSHNENTPRNFLRDAALNRHYGCGNDFVPSDDLSNLMFVVVINDLSEMKWRSDEYMTFSIIHQDNSKRCWTNTDFTLVSSKMHPVMSAINKVLFWVSDDETTLYLDVGEVFRGVRLKHPIRSLRPTMEDKTEMIHTFIESNLPDFHEHVVCLILKNNRFGENEQFVIDGRRLRKSFPKLGSVCCTNNFEIADTDDEMCVLDPFDLGEMSFYLALDDDIPMANTFVHDLWALDHKWARFFCEVAGDYYRKPEDHLTSNSDSAVHNWTGMDHLFHIYLLGWYLAGDDFFDEADRVYARAHKDFAKAIDLLAIRFQNCGADEVAEKLYWDYRHVENDESPDYEQFAKVLQEAERLVPGVLAKMYDEGVIPRFE